MSVQYQKENNASVITLDGELSFDDLSSLVQCMKSDNSIGEEMQIHAEDLMGIHFACVQYLMALCKMLHASGKKTQFTGPNNDFRELLIKLDILPYLG